MMIRQTAAYTRWMFRAALTTCMVLLGGCISPSAPSGEPLQPLPGPPEIFPDYRDVTVPLNIAPLNFMVEDEGGDFRRGIGFVAALHPCIAIVGLDDLEGHHFGVFFRRRA